LVDRLILSSQPGERNIFERGCLRAGEEWVEANLVPVAGVAVGVAVLQVIDSACRMTLFFHSWLSNIMQEIMNAFFIRPANFTQIYIVMFQWSAFCFISGYPCA
jgi:hypothetical protein